MLIQGPGPDQGGDDLIRRLQQAAWEAYQAVATAQLLDHMQRAGWYITGHCVRCGSPTGRVFTNTTPDTAIPIPEDCFCNQTRAGVGQDIARATAGILLESIPINRSGIHVVSMMLEDLGSGTMRVHYSDVVQGWKWDPADKRRPASYQPDKG